MGIVGLFFIFTIVKMKGPNKQFNRKWAVHGSLHMVVVVVMLMMWWWGRFNAALYYLDVGGGEEEED